MNQRFLLAARQTNLAEKVAHHRLAEIVSDLAGNLQVFLKMRLRLVEIPPVKIEPAQLAVRYRAPGQVLRMLQRQRASEEFAGALKIIPAGIDHPERVQNPSEAEVVWPI